MRFMGKPHGREQNPGDHCRDWRRYHEIADRLKGVNTEIRNTQSQLRDVEKLLPVTGVAADMVISPQMAAADSGVITGTGTSGGADLTAGIVAALEGGAG